VDTVVLLFVEAMLVPQVAQEVVVVQQHLLEVLVVPMRNMATRQEMEMVAVVRVAVLSSVVLDTVAIQQEHQMAQTLMVLEQVVAVVVQTVMVVVVGKASLFFTGYKPWKTTSASQNCTEVCWTSLIAGSSLLFMHLFNHADFGIHDCVFCQSDMNHAT
jgi:hypothetical protein